MTAHRISSGGAWTNTQPRLDGWYAVVFGWDEAEGYFVDAAYWNAKGFDWRSNAAIILQYGPFLNEGLARQWAYANDPQL